MELPPALVGVGAATSAVSAVLGNLWAKVRLAVKTEDAIKDVPELRREFEAHCDEDQVHHAAIRETLAEIRGDLKAIGTNVDWLKRQHDDRR